MSEIKHCCFWTRRHILSPMFSHGEMSKCLHERSWTEYMSTVLTCNEFTFTGETLSKNPRLGEMKTLKWPNVPGVARVSSPHILTAMSAISPPLSASYSPLIKIIGQPVLVFLWRVKYDRLLRTFESQPSTSRLTMLERPWSRRLSEAFNVQALHIGISLSVRGTMQNDKLQRMPQDISSGMSHRMARGMGQATFCDSAPFAPPDHIPGACQPLEVRPSGANHERLSCSNHGKDNGRQVTYTHSRGNTIVMAVSDTASSIAGPCRMIEYIYL
jgi:hypothetical protein